MKFNAKEIAIIDASLPLLTEFDEINFSQLVEQLRQKGFDVSADTVASIFTKKNFAYKEDCITIAGNLVYQYYLTDSGRALFAAQKYQNFIDIEKAAIEKRKIRLSRSTSRNWLNTKVLRFAAFLLFGMAIYSFSMREQRLGSRRHPDVERQNSQRLSDHPARTRTR
jgi:hypothetical protein